MRNNIRAERIQKGWTQQEFADKLGVSRQTIFSIEIGKYIPSTLLALKMSFLMQKKVEDLFSLDAEDHP